MKECKHPWEAKYTCLLCHEDQIQKLQKNLALAREGLEFFQKESTQYGYVAEEYIEQLDKKDNE